MRIHREGTTTLLTAAIVLLAANGLMALLSPTLVLAALPVSMVLFFLLLNFFRNPLRKVAAPDGSVLSPCDGKVVQIVTVREDEFFRDHRILISVFMSPLDVHVNRCPAAGRVVFCRYHPGRYLVAWHPKSSLLNERTTVVIDTGKQQVLFRQIAGVLARRVVCYLKEGDDVAAGQEMGFIKFGSRLDVYLPVTSRVRVATGQRVRGGESVLAMLDQEIAATLA
ncbi:MAG: phosphatidylserine decarboxylase family protein [Chitinophagales bacterium]|nr:phosphatidylserine decarboxylase family protein [Chitinophagales bacterium]MDW8393270.1 phosphatidylserine decarboxylase family protein [Chitinophagales bacterium]